MCKDLKRGQPGEWLVVGRHQMPTRAFGRSSLHHVLDRPFVVFPSIPVAKILVCQFPTLSWITETVLETPNLLLRSDRRKILTSWIPSATSVRSNSLISRYARFHSVSSAIS